MRARLLAWVTATQARRYAAIGLMLWAMSADLAWAILHGIITTLLGVAGLAAGFWLVAQSDRKR